MPTYQPLTDWQAFILECTATRAGTDLHCVTDYPFEYHSQLSGLRVVGHVPSFIDLPDDDTTFPALGVSLSTDGTVLYSFQLYRRVYIYRLYAKKSGYTFCNDMEADVKGYQLVRVPMG